MRNIHLLVTFKSNKSRSEIVELLNAKRLRYTEIMGVITRFSVEVASERVQQILEFFRGLESVLSVYSHDDAPKRQDKRN